MSANKAVNPTNVKSKVDSSLVLKLNAGMILRLISGFISINILIIVLCIIIIFWKVDDGAYTIISTPSSVINNEQQIYYNINNYQILKMRDISAPEGFILPDSIQKYLPLKIDNATRSVYIDKAKKEMSLQEKLDRVKYSIRTNINGTSYQITYSLGSKLKMFLLLLIIVLMYVLLIIIGSLKKGAKSIRKTLKPLSDLAETAKSLNAEV